jgi:CheY-like chemotaxis protein
MEVPSHTPLRVLLLEDDSSDAELVLYELRQAGFLPHWQRVETEEQYLAQLQLKPDLILADYNLPGFDALRALRLRNQCCGEVPFTAHGILYASVCFRFERSSSVCTPRKLRKFT